MNSANSIQSLATQVEQGDNDAAQQLRRELEPSVKRIVRRAIKFGGTTGSRINRSILSRVRALAPNLNFKDSAEPDWVVVEVTRSICDAVIGDLRRSPAQTFCLLDTIAGL